MEEKKDSDSYEKKIQKLREEIEKGWNSGESNRTVQDIIDSKRHSRNKINRLWKTKHYQKKTKVFTYFPPQTPLPLYSWGL